LQPFGLKPDALDVSAYDIIPQPLRLQREGAFAGRRIEQRTSFFPVEQREHLFMNKRGRIGSGTTDGLLFNQGHHHAPPPRHVPYLARNPRTSSDISSGRASRILSSGQSHQATRCNA